MIDETIANAGAEHAYGWQQSRRKPDGHFDVPACGFKNGTMTVWLPTAKTSTRVVIRDRKPVRETLSAASNPDLDVIRERVLQSFRLNPAKGTLAVDELFYEYAIRVLCLNYELSDEDLTELLSGTKWHRDIVAHLWGGEEFLIAYHDQAFEVLQHLSLRPPAPPAEMPRPTSRRLIDRFCFWK